MIIHESCGIDFGTSNSAIGVSLAENVELIKVEDGKETIPTALFFPHDRSPVLFGRTAQKQYMLGAEGRFMRSLKRILGTSLIDQTTSINGKAVPFDDIIGAFVRNLRNKTLDKYPNINNVVMGRPVHFIDDNDDGDRKAQSKLEEIARKVGFKNVEFQFEPIAAAFAHEQHLTKEKLSLVADIGGGTSDFTIIRLSPENKLKADRKSDILGNSGVRIGGNDFDKDLSISIVMPHLGYESTYGEKNLLVPRSHYHDISEWSKVNFVYTPKILSVFKHINATAHERAKLQRFISVIEKQQGHRLLNSIEESKIALTTAEAYNIDLEYIEPEFGIGVRKSEFNYAIEKDTAKVIDCAKQCLKLCSVKAEQIELIILTGGSTEIPYLQALLCGLFPNAAVSAENKLSSVTLGLAHDARRKF